MKGINLCAVALTGSAQVFHTHPFTSSCDAPLLFVYYSYSYIVFQVITGVSYYFWIMLKISVWSPSPIPFAFVSLTIFSEMFANNLEIQFYLIIYTPCKYTSICTPHDL